MEQKYFILIGEKTKKIETLEAELLDYLKNHGPASFQELVKKLEIEADEKGSFSYLLRRLEMEGLIKSKPINLDIAGGFLFTTLYEITSKEA
jgi:DNA-binding Lrp family transcriptional regulator